jgi:hypothetical protein
LFFLLRTFASFSQPGAFNCERISSTSAMLYSFSFSKVVNSDVNAFQSADCLTDFFRASGRWTLTITRFAKSSSFPSMLTSTTSCALRFRDRSAFQTASRASCAFAVIAVKAEKAQHNEF